MEKNATTTCDWITDHSPSTVKEVPFQDPVPTTRAQYAKPRAARARLTYLTRNERIRQGPWANGVGGPQGREFTNFRNPQTINATCEVFNSYMWLCIVLATSYSL
ncbi:hypothetical protein Y032_0181g848 [Ancylostoma ceylanicum]|uniref:Uncharacterized protein n=1 Tax=Ancylostoma ceylanicum TaxID=53326 RepID=A0A016SS25_9BILA|nr:hypothetical protein Y032_0181g848 [Ancylostoma ceylanicum]